MSRVPITPTVAVNLLQAPVVDSNGMAAPGWQKWFQNVTQAINNGLTLAGVALKLPFPTLGTLGGVQASTAVKSQWISQIDASGVPQLSQPAVADISGIGSGAVTATSATVGAATALPAQPVGYLVLSINGTSYKVPFYGM